MSSQSANVDRAFLLARQILSGSSYPLPARLPGGLEALHPSFALSQRLMGILCPVILPATRVVSPRKPKFAQCRAVGSKLVGHDGGWSDALLLQEPSHQLERRLAVSPRLNQDVQDLAFAVHGTPDVQLSAVDGDEHFVEMPPHIQAQTVLVSACGQ